MKKHRKHYTPEEKVAVLRRHLLEKEPVSRLCDELRQSARDPFEDSVLKSVLGHYPFESSRRCRTILAYAAY